MSSSSQNQPLRRSTRLATIIPASYWISIGYAEEFAQTMERFQLDMKNLQGDAENSVMLQPKDSDGNDIHGIMPHHDLLLPHLEKFAIALSGRANIERVEITGIAVLAPVLENIFAAMRSIQLKKLQLICIDLGDSGFLQLSSFLKDNSSLINLQLAGDEINDTGVASSLSDEITNHPSLQTLVLAKCGLNNVNILSRILEGCTRLRQISIAQNEIGSDGATVLADFIGGNHSVETLDLERNRISDSDTPMLATALGRNTRLGIFDLTRNNVTEDGRNVLLKALFDTTSMDSIVESNHTCSLNTCYDATGNGWEQQLTAVEGAVILINFEGDSIGEKIRKKVILALCMLDGELFDLSHFNNVPLQLMPRVLELIQEHTRHRTRRLSQADLDKEALSRLFHTLRGWKMPLLFENVRLSVSVGQKRKRNIVH